MISEAAALDEIQPHLARLWSAVTQAHERFRENPDRPLLRPGTAAGVLCDLIFAEFVREFDEVPGVVILESKAENYRYLSLSPRVNLWLKKVDDQRNSRNYPTRRAKRRDLGQENFFGADADLILAGYQLSSDETNIRRLTFSPPKHAHPRWWIDVRAVKRPLKMSLAHRDAASVELEVSRASSQLAIA